MTTVRPQKEAKELPASDAPAGSQAQFEGERGRDDRGEFQISSGSRWRWQLRLPFPGVRKLDFSIFRVQNSLRCDAGGVSVSFPFNR